MKRYIMLSKFNFPFLRSAMIFRHVSCLWLHQLVVIGALGLFSPAHGQGPEDPLAWDSVGDPSSSRNDSESTQASNSNDYLEWLFSPVTPPDLCAGLSQTGTVYRTTGGKGTYSSSTGNERVMNTVEHLKPASVQQLENDAKMLATTMCEEAAQEFCNRQEQQCVAGSATSTCLKVSGGTPKVSYQARITPAKSIKISVDCLAPSHPNGGAPPTMCRCPST